MDLFPGLEDPSVPDAQRDYEVPPRPQEECPGKGVCHGCLNWCENCGDVGYVCDSPDCDTHQRPQDIRAELEEILAELKQAALDSWFEGRNLPDPGNALFPARHRNDIRRYRSRIRTGVAEVDRLEDAVREVVERLRRTVEAGERIIPRGSPRPFKGRGTW